ncbi:MAG: hypothetical protein RLO80_03305 [Hyphomonas sp.]
MKPYVWILMGGLLLAPPGLALKPTPASPASDAHTSDLSNELSAFVRQAMDEGLLDPVGTAKAAEAAQPVLELRRAQELPIVTGPVDCSRPYPLDFTNFDRLKRYDDIYAYREETPEAGEAAHEGNPGLTLAKAYMSLDLASEAAMTVRTGRDQDAAALRNLAVLLEGSAPAPTAYFAELAACYPSARFWHGLALVSGQEPAGADLLESNLTAFRQLPLQLRDRAAMIAISELDALGKRTLATMLIASFSEEEIANSSQLRFSQAVLALGAGDPDAEKLIGQFLIQSRYQEASLAALIRHKRPVNSNVREILVDDMVTRIELAQKNADVRGDLRFVLDEMSAGSMYLPMMKLAELPSMQSDAARQELTQHLAASLKRDLASDDSLRTLAAIEALIKDPGLLEGLPERAELYETATTAAVRLGFGTLGDALSDKAQGGEGVAEQRAVLAYRQKKTEEVYGLASRYPANQKINLLAAQAAIDANDRVKLPALEARLRMEPDTILTLIEQDAATANWIVSDAVFSAASKLTDESQQRRVARVIRLKQAPVQAASAGRVSMSSIPGKLSRTRQSLDQLTGEAP